MVERYQLGVLERRLAGKTWRFLYRHGCRVALLGTRRANNEFKKVAKAEHLALVAAEVVPREMETRLSGLQVDLVVIVDQPGKWELKQSAARLTQGRLPIVLLYEDLVNCTMRQKLKGAAEVDGFLTSYTLSTSRRTGATMLCHLLSQTGVAGNPGEYLSVHLPPLLRLRNPGCKSAPAGVSRLESEPQRSGGNEGSLDRL